MKYALVTAARNEAANLRRLIPSVAAQTQLPERWVIVSHGSSDGTDDVVLEHAERLPWMSLLRLPSSERSWSGMVQCVNAGFAALRDVPFDVLGKIDADVTFPPEYMETLVARFEADPRLGSAGTRFLEPERGFSWWHPASDETFVAGPCALFRRSAFERMGGMVPAPHGTDVIATEVLLSLGWKTTSFPDPVYTHHGLTGGREGSWLREWFYRGRTDAYVRNHPVWQLARVVFRMKDRPMAVGALAMLAGYVWQSLRNEELTVAAEVMRSRRARQTRHLLDLIRSALGPRHA
jgi:glycosyltransferase involved in cell wall biosynthesis